MKYSRATRGLVAALALVSLPAFALSLGEQPYSKRFAINAGGGYYDIDHELNVDGTGFPSLGLEYRFTPAMSLEASYLQTQSNAQRNEGADYDVNQLRLDGNYYFRSEQPLQPFVSIGAGTLGVKQDEKNIDINDTIGDAGVGVRYFVNDSLAVRSDLRAINNFDSGYTDGLLNVSLNLMLGANRTEATDDFDLTGRGAGPGASDGDQDGIADRVDNCLNTEPGLLVDENGCGIPVESTVSMDLNVNFEFESAKLPPEFYSDVKELATFLKTYDNSIVTIEGHADATGPEGFNKGLSERRAKAIRDILVKDFEIDADRLDFIGYGENKPIADNATEVGRSKNRRAATIVNATREKKLDKPSR